MKTKLGIGILLLVTLAASAQTNNLTSLLQQGLFEEQANRNLDAAIADYQSLAMQFDKDRRIAATAIFRLGECYRALGKTNEAAAQYQRILQDFSDQSTLVTLSRQNLAGMRIQIEPTASAARQRQIELLEKQIALAQTNLAEVQKRFQLGRAKQSEVTAAEQQAVQLQITLAGLNANPAAALNSMSSAGSTEDQEIQRIQQMIQNSPDLISAPDSNGNTPLEKAASNGWLKVAAFLLDHGADVNARGGLALIDATKAGNRAMVELLLGRGANVNANKTDTANNTPLHIAVQKGYQAVAEVLLANKADVNAQTRQGYSPLLLATQNNDANIVSMLLEHKADVDIQDQSGRTPLNEAARLNCSEIVKLLLAVGANPNVPNKDGRTTLSYAAGNGSSKIVKALLTAKADLNGGSLDAPLLAAIHVADTNSAKLLLQAGADPNAYDPVDWGIHVGHTTYGRYTVTPLWLAVHSNEFPMVQLLLNYKADANDSQTDRRSLLFSALGNPDILKALLDAGAKVDARDVTDIINNTIYKRTALIMAASGADSSNQVEVLLRHGADANARDSEGRTALHWAACNAPADESVFELLLDCKADPNVRDNYGKTPLKYLKWWLQNDSTGRFQTIAAKQELVNKLIVLLHHHGALDNLPSWDRIAISRPAANFSEPVFYEGTNGWNRFTLLEAIRNFYSSSRTHPVSQGNGMQINYSGDDALPFPDLSHVIIVRPSHNSTNRTRIVINLLNSTNGIDCSKDVPLEFGDVVEIPERDHALGDKPVGLTESQREMLLRFLKADVRLVVRGQTVDIPIYPCFDSSISAVLKKSEARNLLLSSSDLSHVKVIRENPKTGKKREWILDCSPSSSSADRPVVVGIIGLNQSQANFDELWLRNGDVIEVPEKP